MAVSAFKSTSKRGNIATSTSNPSSSNANPTISDKNSNTKIPHRRSRSVSAVSRSSASSSSTVLDFLNKRDNPLFCSSSPTHQDEVESEHLVRVSKFDECLPQVSQLIKKPVGIEVSDSRRGRSVSRGGEPGNGTIGGRKEIGRSLSRVDMGRGRRSVSRGRYETSESEKEHKSSVFSRLHNQNNRSQVANTKKIGRDSESLSRGRSLQTLSTHKPISQPSDGSSDTNWEDGISTSSFSEAEEKTIKAVFEQIESNRRAADVGAGEIYEAVRSEVRIAISEIQNDLKMAIQRKDPNVMATDNLGGNPLELVNPDAVELVCDIRREYASKLEESEERARKLRADLAVEEHRGQELGKVLKEILPEPKAFETRQSRFRRKNSNERRKMSRRLTEEAMNYFDECVSISTFDSSDFSSTEDPSVSLVTMTPLIDKNVCFPPSSASSNHGVYDDLNYKKELECQVEGKLVYESPDSTMGSSTKVATDLVDSSTARSPSFQCSSHDPTTEASGNHYDIKKYIKKFEKKTQTDGRDSSAARSSYYDSDEYELRVSDERFLLDRVTFNNRIESGGLLLCGNGILI